MSAAASRRRSRARQADAQPLFEKTVFIADAEHLVDGVRTARQAAAFGTLSRTAARSAVKVEFSPAARRHDVRQERIVQIGKNARVLRAFGKTRQSPRIYCMKFAFILAVSFPCGRRVLPACRLNAAANCTKMQNTRAVRLDFPAVP